jgi:hypothetical protein
VATILAILEHSQCNGDTRSSAGKFKFPVSHHILFAGLQQFGKGRNFKYTQSFTTSGNSEQ